jgi:hypothetical protein
MAEAPPRKDTANTQARVRLDRASNRIVSCVRCSNQINVALFPTNHNEFHFGVTPQRYAILDGCLRGF